METNVNPKISIREVSALVGLREAGFELNGHPIRGRVMVGRRNRIGVKRYSFRLRVGDRAVLYRWGQLRGAGVTYIDGRKSHVVFYAEEK